jgi:RNA polymerase-interacting CarD/CdnL/TRCF family regulator
MRQKQVLISKDMWVVHTDHGVGQVKGKDEKVLGGNRQAFFKVRTSKYLYRLPVSRIDTDRIRPLSSKHQLRRALTLIRKSPNNLPQDQKQRDKEVFNALKDISLYSKARMIRDLNGKKETSKLNVGEKKVFEKIKKHFLDEWLVVVGEDHETLEGRLEKVLEISVGGT